VRVAAAKALLLRGETGVRILVSAVGRADESTRKTLTNAFAILRPTTINSIAAFLKGGTVDERLAAAWILGNTSRTAPTEPLVHPLVARRPQVGGAAKYALELQGERGMLALLKSRSGKNKSLATAAGDVLESPSDSAIDALVGLVLRPNTSGIERRRATGA